MNTPAPKPLKLFCSYAHEDEEHLHELRQWLHPLEREGIIDWWHDREIPAGSEWDESVDKHLRTADIILLLVTPDFMASDYVYENEISKAVEKHERGEARVIPIIVRPADWERSDLAKLKALPKDAKPITSWSNRDEAWLDVEKGIREVFQELSIRRRYHTTVEETWRDNKVSDTEAEQLGALASDLGIDTETTTDTELEVIGDTIETILECQEQAKQARKAAALYDRGLRHKEDEKWPQALQSFNQALRLKPDNPDAWIGKSSALDNLGRYEESLGAAEEALKLQPDNPNAWDLKGRALANLDRWQEALEAYEETIRLKSDNFDAWLVRSWALVTLGRYQEALEAFDQTLRLKPDNPDAWIGKSSALDNLGRYEESLGATEEALKLQPDNPNAWNARSDTLNAAGRHDEALEAAEEVVRLSPDDPSAWVRKSLELGNLGRDQESLEAAEEALKLRSDNPSAWSIKGQALVNLGRYEESLEALNKALSLAPDYHDAIVGKNFVLGILGRWK